MKLKRILAVLAAMTITAVSFTACSEDESSVTDETKENNEISAETSETEETSDLSGQTIYWLSDYDLNPSGSEERSTALTIFEDTYGGKIQWIPTTAETKYDDLANMLLGGEEVDMFPYDSSVFPDGVLKNQFQPLDDYINLDDEMWTDTKEIADKMAYDGKHYVIPYAVSDPACLIYSRKLMKDEGFDDPYELYQKGEWNWDTFLSMMEYFVSGSDERYGCTGNIAKALVQSSGQGFVNYDGSSFTSNITSPEIEEAELVLEKIGTQGLYDDTWHGYFPEDNSTLFYGMAPWALAESNGKNSDGDIFLVPFPKMSESENYYISTDYSARMLVAGSGKGEAVATYIKCEKTALSDEKYQDSRKEQALIPTLNYNGEKTKFVTEEQYDACQGILNAENTEVVFDFGYGMGSRMSLETYDYSTRGIMNNLTDALISGYEGSPSSWSELCDEFKDDLESEIKKFN